MRHKIYNYYRALDLALRLWNPYTMPRNWEPFDAISWRTAWDVGCIVHVEGR